MNFIESIDGKLNLLSLGIVYLDSNTSAQVSER